MRFRRLRSILAPVKPVDEPVLEFHATVAAHWASAAFQMLQRLQWWIPPQPEHFDHRIDLHHGWQRTRDPKWIERGVFSGLALRGGQVLELCCGDGFNARNFYSIRSSRVLACDFDPAAIRVARRRNVAPNVSYQVADIRRDIPAGIFDNVIWDGAIEHFTRPEIETILAAIRNRLTSDGVLSGFTIVEGTLGKALSHHETCFEDKEDLAEILKRTFQNVTVFETIYKDRHNLYFWAGNGVLP